MSENEPNPEPAIPECPEELSDEAKKEWERVSAELLPMGLLSRVDRAALAGYCQAWATWIEAQASLREYGVIIKSPNGYPMSSPYLSVANKALAASRARIIVSTDSRLTWSVPTAMLRKLRAM